jgi:hypothetical protein
MGFLDGIFSKSQQTTTTAAPAANPNVQSQAATHPANAQANTGSGAGPVTKLAADAVPNSQAQLDKFASLMTPKKGAQQQAAAPKGVFGHVDPAAMQAQIRQANFVSGLPQDKVAAALGGDAAAFGEVLNSAIQSAFEANVNLTRGMVEHSVNYTQDQVNSGLDSRIRDFQVRSHNSNIDNPALQHPVGKSMLKGITQQIANANPELTPSEVTRQAEEHFTQFLQLAGNGFTQQNAAATKASGPKETNWLTYLDESSAGTQQ